MNWNRSNTAGVKRLQNFRDSPLAKAAMARTRDQETEPGIAGQNDQRTLLMDWEGRIFRCLVGGLPESGSSGEGWEESLFCGDGDVCEPARRRG